jgi:hypothetical protein
MFQNRTINNISFKFFIFCLFLLFILSISHISLAQDNLISLTNVSYATIDSTLQIKDIEAEMENEIIAQLEEPDLSSLVPLRRMGAIVHAGAVQIGPSTDDVCISVVKADTFLTIVNPSATFLVTCSDCPLPYFDIVGKVVLFNNDGTYVGHTVFKVPPKGNKTISLAKVLLSNNLDTRSHIRKYTYDIVWYVPKLVRHLERIKCRVPFIPISVEVKEVIYKNWICLSSYIYSNDDAILDDRDILVNRTISERIQTMSETILDKSNIIYPILYAIDKVEIETSDTPISDTKPVDLTTGTTLPVTQTSNEPTTLKVNPVWSVPSFGSKLQTWGVNNNTSSLFNTFLQ